MERKIDGLYSRCWWPHTPKEFFGSCKLFVADADVRWLHRKGPTPGRKLFLPCGVKQI